MNIQEILKEKGYTKYRLSKESGVPWATLSDICSGKTDLAKCSAGTLNKLAKTLNMTMEELILVKAEEPSKDGYPNNKEYLEASLPGFVQKDIEALLEGKRDNVSYLDCLYDELYGSINACQWDGIITKEQADYLRYKYIFRKEDEND
ncbi:MAG: helix-turn-helix transcriptional regulator [Clostridiales bacterium]|nr:helix-turn-helix transcriptional regulator [Clostridiales bacterium]